VCHPSSTTSQTAGIGRRCCFLRSSTAFGKPYAAPPGVPADRIAVLRKAFEDTLKDPQFLADAATRN